MTVKKAKFYTGTGRRKRAVASVWLYNEKGEFKIQDKPLNKYFTSSEDSLNWVQPFHAIGVAHPQSKYSATIKVYGGGIKAQLDAVRLGFARALVSMDESYRNILRTNGLLTRDDRRVERKKPFFVKARKKPQYSKR